MGTSESLIAVQQAEIAKLKQERDELAAQVEVMREFIVGEYSDKHGGDRYDSECDICRLISITKPDALREVKATAVEDAKEDFYGYKNHTSDEMFVATAIQLLDNLAASIRKGE